MKNYIARAACAILLTSSFASGQSTSTSATDVDRASNAGRLAFIVASVRPSTQAFAPKGVDFLNPASDAPLNDPPMHFRLTVTGPNQGSLVNESEKGPGLPVVRSDY